MGIVTVGSELPLLAEIARLPLAVPVAVGVNWAVKVVLAPAASRYGSAMPLILNAFPVALILVTFSLAVPEFAIITVCLAVVPTLTLLNEIVVGLAANATVPGLLLEAAGRAPTNPAQPERAIVVTTAIAKAKKPALQLRFGNVE